MPELVVDGDDLVVRLSRWERFWAFHPGDLRMPLSSVQTVELPPNPWLALRGWRSSGVSVPGRAALGRRRHGTGWDFAAVRAPHDVVEVHLNAGPFERVLVSVEDPPAAARRVAEAAGIRGP